MPATQPTSSNHSDGDVKLKNTDFYFSESYQISNGYYQPHSSWHDKAEQVRGYQKTYDFCILSLTTTMAGFDAGAFNYAWYSAVLYGHEAIG